MRKDMKGSFHSLVEIIFFLVHGSVHRESMSIGSVHRESMSIGSVHRESMSIGSVHRESMSIIVQQDATIYSSLYICKLLYMFRVIPSPIIRSTCKL